MLYRSNKRRARTGARIPTSPPLLALFLSCALIAADASARGALTSENGAYRIDGVPAGDVVVLTTYIGRAVGRRSTTVRAGAEVRVDFELDVQPLSVGELVVSTSREAQRRVETPATVGVITNDALRDVRPAHPSEIVNRVPGVWINVTGGEGHMAAIRQPKTTNPVYLYAEDGVPTRSTGFFNHNALYEVNVPQADRIEVVKGPATALYGSDAIGGAINVVTRAPAAEPTCSRPSRMAFAHQRRASSSARAARRTRSASSR